MKDDVEENECNEKRCLNYLRGIEHVDGCVHTNLHMLHGKRSNSN